MVRRWVILTLVSLCVPSYALRKSRFQSLLVPLDFFATPTGQNASPLSRARVYSILSRNGLTIKQAEEDLKSAQESFRLSYDQVQIPRLTLNSSMALGDALSSNVKTYSKSYSLGLGISGNTGWGFNYSLDLPRFTTSYYDTLGSISDSSSVSIGGSVGLSLLKGSYFFLGRNVKDQADLNWQFAKESRRSTVLQTILQAELTFYSVLLKNIRVRVLQSALDSARALLSDINDMLQSGETDRLSVVKVELQVAQTETDLLAAQSDLATSRQTLRDLLAMNDTEFSALVPDPNEVKESPSIPNYTLEAALTKAKKQRPDYITGMLTRKKAELDVDAAFSAALPSLELKGSYGYVGTDSTLPLAFSRTLKLGPPQYSVGFEFTYNFLNDSDKTGYRQAKIRLMKTELSIQQLNNQLQKELASNLASVELGYRKLKTSGLARELSEKRMQAEFEKFRLGESNVRNIIDFQAELNNARISEISARVELLSNLANLRTSLGELPPGVSLKENQ